MKIFPSLVLFLLPFSQSENLTSTALLHKMYDRYQGKWQNNLSFNQTTGQYQNDKLVKTTIWYEHILYPETNELILAAPQAAIATFK